MADNNLLLFGEDLNKTGTGKSFDDTTWETAEQNNSTIRKTGFIPGTGASSIAMNTVLRQAAFGAYIIGQLLSADSITDLKRNVSAQSDIENAANTLSNALINYLKKIQQFQEGTLYVKNATYAKDFIAGGAIDIAIQNLSDDINSEDTSIQKIINGVTPAGVAKDYDETATNEGSINYKFEQVSQHLKDITDNINKKLTNAPVTVWRRTKSDGTIISSNGNVENNNTYIQYAYAQYINGFNILYFKFNSSVFATKGLINQDGTINTTKLVLMEFGVSGAHTNLIGSVKNLGQVIMYVYASNNYGSTYAVGELYLENIRLTDPTNNSVPSLRLYATNFKLSGSLGAYVGNYEFNVIVPNSNVVQIYDNYIASNLLNTLLIPYTK